MRRVRYWLSCRIIQWAYDRLEEESRWYGPAYRLGNWIAEDVWECDVCGALHPAGADPHA